jgi:hypothetical protein
MTDYGFTGGKTPPTPESRQWLLDQLHGLIGLPAVLHHGDCVGADALANELAIAAGIRVVIHPPVSEHWRANCDPGLDGEIRNPAPYLMRDRHIVAETASLIALPDRPHAIRGSGTWYTVRQAIHRERHILIPPWWEDELKIARRTVRP